MTDPGSCRLIDQQADSKLPGYAVESRPFHFYLSVFRFVLFVFLGERREGGEGHRIKASQTQTAAD